MRNKIVEFEFKKMNSNLFLKIKERLVLVNVRSLWGNNSKFSIEHILFIKAILNDL